MPIERGVEWGAPGLLPASAPVVGGDAALATQVAQGCRLLGVVGGDLARTLGVTHPYDRSTAKHLVPVDAIRVQLDERPDQLCVAHVLVGRSFLSPDVQAIMNAAFVGRHNLTPRSHPGDGKLDVVTMRLAIGDRIKALRRMRTGSHVPHPNISISRQTSGTLEFTRPRHIRIDGVSAGRASTIRYAVEPDAYTIAVS